MTTIRDNSRRKTSFHKPPIGHCLVSNNDIEIFATRQATRPCSAPLELDSFMQRF
jgi:hypothetical protein